MESRGAGGGGEPGLRGGAVKSGRLDQGVAGGGALAACVEAGKEVIFAPKSGTAQGLLGGVVVDGQAAVIQIAQASWGIRA